MVLTKQTVAEKIGDWLTHQITQEQLVDWAENAVMAGEFEATDVKLLSNAVARLGVADVRAFGLAWPDCEKLLADLGFSARVQIVHT